jgi:hypothetical protein
MKSISIDNLYTQIDKHLRLVEAYTEIKGLAFIMKACRLKPCSYVFDERIEKIILFREWFDEFGNSFKITNNKKIQITHNDLSLDRNKIVCTDLYYGLSLDRVAKISKLFHLYIGKDEDLYQDCSFLTFLGIDNYLRSYMCLYSEWKQVSPLLLGVPNLKIIENNQDIKYFRELPIKEKSPLPCVAETQWLTFTPPSQSFMMMLAGHNNKLLPIFNGS